MKFAAITMSRLDGWMLRRWASWYAFNFGAENVFIYLDGKDQDIPEGLPEGCNVTLVDKLGGSDLVSQDKTRISFINERAAELRARGYDCIVGCDCDEFLVPDPRLGLDLKDFLKSEALKGHLSVSGLGLDVGEHLHNEDHLDDNATFLSQRSYALVSSRYTKPIAVFASCEWGSGFHRIKGHGYYIPEGLYLLHFGCVDYQRILSKFQRSDLMDTGWEKHLKKRTLTNNLVTFCKKPSALDDVARRARRHYRLFRQPQAWNKPWETARRIVVRLPDCFAVLPI